MWVFINNQLVIDLGGVHGTEAASVALNTLGLTAGQTYDFDFYFAERHTSGSNLNITTSIAFDPNPVVPEPATMTLLALGGVATIVGRRGSLSRRAS